MTTKLVLHAAGLACALLWCASANASSGRQQAFNTTPIYISWLTIPANTTAKVETLNLSPSTADTVINLQATGGGYFGGNDDAGDGSLRSSVTISASSVARNIMVLVRAYSNYSNGTATVRTTMGSSAPTDQPNVTFGGQSMSVPLAAGSEVTTVQEQGGANDTVVLAVSSNAAQAFAFDDDSGLGYMSLLTIPGEAPAQSLIVVGSYNQAQTGTTTVVWDEQVKSKDTDGDGLGDALEAFLGTSPASQDSDSDGLTDGNEVLGVADTSNAGFDQLLPAWGADPLYPDVFIEADYVSGSQLVGSDAAYAAGHFAPDFHVHIDTGVGNSDPGSRTTWGAWGGAEVATSLSSNCNGFSAQREGLFHHVIVDGYDGGQTTSSTCSLVGAKTVAHEMGHQLGLAHGGGDGFNCKPHYLSTMNYAYQDTMGSFSRGTRTAVLDPTQMNEGTGLGTTDATTLGKISGYPFSYTVNTSTGAVDWNRDGKFDTSLVRAAPEVTGSPYDCDIAVHANAWDDPSHKYYAYGQSLQPTLVSFLGFSRLYMFSRSFTDGTIFYRWTNSSGLAACSASNPAETCAGWTPPQSQAPQTDADQYVFAANTTGVGALGAASFSSAANSGTMMVAWLDSSRAIKYGMLTSTAAPPVVAAVPSAVGPFHDVGVSVVDVGLQLQVYAVDDDGAGGTVLKRWVYVKSSGSWLRTNEVVHWQDGTAIAATYPPAWVIAPKSAASSTPTTWAAMVTGGGAVQLASFTTASSGVWIPHPEVWSAMAAPTTLARPGLAFEPFDSTTPAGRFYLAWVPDGGGGTPGITSMAFTQGNDTATKPTRAFKFLNGLDVYNEWGKDYPGNGPSLFYDASDTSNPHLRLALTGSNKALNFAPLADGILKTGLVDFNDYAEMRTKLVTSL